MSERDVSQPAEDATRRTLLAAERTWLAWWRSGIAAATAAVAVGGVIPELVDSGRSAYVALGVGYAALAAGTFAAAARRQRQIRRALERADYAALNDRAVIALTLAGMALAVGTLVLILVEA